MGTNIPWETAAILSALFHTMADAVDLALWHINGECDDDCGCLEELHRVLAKAQANGWQSWRPEERSQN